MEKEKKKRANDKAAKQQFQKILAKVFSVDEKRICITNRTTDVILKNGNDEKDWIYFELKCTSDEVLEKNDEYFGAISMNQWNTYIDHKDRYFFVIAIEGDNGTFRFAIISPDRIEKYLTGIYIHTDFSIPKTLLNGTCNYAIEYKLETIKNDTFIDDLTDCQGKQDLINKLHYELNH